MSQPTDRKDNWNSKDYKSAAGFVPKLTSTVVSYLAPQPTDDILDLGCGDGQLTAKVAASAHSVLGIDASKSFIDTANAEYKPPNVRYLLHDATDLETCPPALTGQWHKVFSNAAMHWILRRPETRRSYFRAVHAALRPGGAFVFEMGGKGNVAEIHAAATAALLHAGVPLSEAREASPWFFPTPAWMEAVLRESGFEVEVCETEYRPSPLAEGALEGWVRLMCADFLQKVPAGRAEDVLREICEVVEGVVRREEDGGMSLGYVRLRGVARKK